MSAHLSRRRVHTLVGAVLLTGAVGSCASGDSKVRGPVGSEPASPAHDTRAELVTLLEARSAAVLAKDESAHLATLLDPTAPRAESLRAQFAALVPLPFSTVRYAGVRLLADSSPSSSLSSEPSVTFEAELRHSYAGFDLGERTSTQVLTAVRSTKGWRLSEQLACTGEPALWSDPTFLLRMSADVLLLSTEGVEETEQRFADAARAVRLAREAWPGASAPAADRGLVLLSPATAEQHALVTQQGEVTELTGSSAASAPTTPQVAAITDGPDGPGGRSTADRVVVNPLALGRLTPPGRAFVLAHEAVHVRLRAMTGGRLPAWLSEGFADWVAYRHTGLDAAVIAAPALPDVRSGTLPTSFPAPSDFDSSTTALAPAYARSWVLVSLLVERHGESAVRDLIATIAATTSDAAISGDAISGAAGSAIDAATDAAFSSVLGTTRSEVLAQWLARLRLLAAAGQP